MPKEPIQTTDDILSGQDEFSGRLFALMQKICPAVGEMAEYEFGYCLQNLIPGEGWNTVRLNAPETLERTFQSRTTYEKVAINPKIGGKTILDETITDLTRMLFVGLVTGTYTSEWVQRNFYFDPRGFIFLHRTVYFTSEVLAHLGNVPFRQFEARQKDFERAQAVGYSEFRVTNAEVDEALIKVIDHLIQKKGMPIIIGIAGPTAAGKTEITARICERLEGAGKRVTTFEMDHFFLDRDYREANGIDSLGKEALHYDLFLNSLRELCSGNRIVTPRYDFITGNSSHDLSGHLKPGAGILSVEPADIIFLEGNFPFLLPEVASLIGIKVVYLTDDDVRLKRKWRRDMDFRKKYELNYFRNRYFREQLMMAESAFIPQLQACDIAVDTTFAKLWLDPNILNLLVDSPVFSLQ